MPYIEVYVSERELLESLSDEDLREEYVSRRNQGNDEEDMVIKLCHFVVDEIKRSQLNIELRQYVETITDRIMTRT